MRNLWERVARLRVDLTPLRESRDFCLLFWAGSVFYLGGMVSHVALPFQLYQLTRSNFAIGALGIVELVPLVVFGLYGGALAGHIDRPVPGAGHPGVPCTGADMVSGLFRLVIWNQTILDSMRGRLAGIEMLSYSLGPLGGQARAGLVADRWSVRGSITSGGILCVVGVVLTASWLHGFWAYDVRTDEDAVLQRRLRAEPAG